MASLVLSVGAAALIPSGATAVKTALITTIAGTVGSIIDTELLLPLLAKQETPTINTPSLPARAEGAPANYVAGTHNRVPGHILWQGAPRFDVTDQVWRVDLIVGFATCPEYQAGPNSANPAKAAVGTFREILAGSETLWVLQRTENQLGTVFAQTRSVQVGTTGSGSPIYETFVDYNSTTAAVDFTDFYVGVPITVQGYTNDNLNSPGLHGNTFTPIGTRQASDGSTRMTCRTGSLFGNTLTPTQSETANAARFIQPIPPSNQRQVTGVKVYNGTNGHNPSQAGNFDALKAAEGTNIPGFHWTAVAELNGFNIDRYGNSVPDFEAIFAAPDPLTTTVKQVEHLCRMSGMDANHLDISRWDPRKFWSVRPSYTGRTNFSFSSSSGESRISSTTDNEWSVLGAGDRILVAGATNAANSGVFTVLRIENGGGTGRDLVLSPGSMVTEAAGAPITIRTGQSEITHYAISGTRTPAESIEDILVVNDGLHQERNGKMTFFGRDQISTTATDESLRPVPVNVDHMATEQGNRRPSDFPYLTQEIRGRDLPTSVIVEFFDSEKRMQPGSVMERLQPGTDGENVKNIKLPYGMTHGEARDLALRLLHQPRRNTKRFTLSLPGPLYMHVLENDVLTWTDPKTSRPMRAIVVRRDLGINWVAQFECVEEPEATNFEVIVFPESNFQGGDESGPAMEQEPNLVMAASIPSRGL